MHPIGNDTYLVPKALDKAKVDRYGKLMQSELTQFGFVYPTDVREGVTVDQAREDYLSAVRRRGYWVNNESGNGLVLIDPRGIPVIDGAGNRYEFTFDDALKYAPPGPSEWEWPVPFSKDNASKQSPFAGEVMGKAKQYGVPERLALGVHLAEWNPRQRISQAGAIGEMQLMPGTARDLGVNPNNSSENIDGGVRYLKQMLDRYQGDITRALVAYNWGPARADKWDGIMSKLPAETRNYVSRIKRFMG